MKTRRSIFLAALVMLAATGASRSAAAEDEPDPALAAAPAPAPASGPVTQISLTSDRSGTVLLRQAERTVIFLNHRGVETTTVVPSYVPVCAAPCTAAVDGRAVYRIGGSNVVASETFNLPVPGAAAASIAVNAGSPGARRWGLWMVETGVLFTLIGGLTLISGYVGKPDSSEARFANEPKYFQEASDNAERLRIIGFVLAPLGILTLTVGAILVAANSTDVSFGNAPRAVRPRPPKLALAADGVHF